MHCSAVKSGTVADVLGLEIHGRWSMHEHMFLTKRKEDYSNSDEKRDCYVFQLVRKAVASETTCNAFTKLSAFPLCIKINTVTNDHERDRIKVAVLNVIE